MAEKLDSTTYVERERGGRAPWKQWADGELWRINVNEDLPVPVTVERAAATAASWARRNGYKFYYELRSPTELVVRFRAGESLLNGRPTDEFTLFELFMNTHVEVTGDPKDTLDYPIIWREWSKYRTNPDVLMAHGDPNARPRAMRLLREPLLVWNANRPRPDDANVVHTPVGAKRATLYGIRLRTNVLDAPPTVTPKPVMETIARAIETPAPSTSTSTGPVKLPPSPFGSNQPDEAPLAPTEPTEPVIYWNALNALSAAIDKLDEDN